MSFAKRIATIVLAATAGVFAAADDGRRHWTVKGHGFGHGVGLSQYGAYGYAAHGVGYQKILAHYYTGTDLGRQSGRVRVLLGESGSVEFTGAGKGLWQAPREALEVQRSSPPAAGSSCATPAATSSPRCGGEGKAVERAQDLRLRLLSRQPRRPRGRRAAAGDQRARLRGLRPRRRRQRVARVVAGRRPSRAGRRRPHLRARDFARRHLRPVRRHPQPGLRRQGLRDQGDQPSGRRHRQAGRHLQGRPRAHLLLLDLGRPDRETPSTASPVAARSRTCARSRIPTTAFRPSTTGPRPTPTTTWRRSCAASSAAS